MLVVGLVMTAYLLVAAAGCYRGDPPCDPSTVDWPRCRPWDPPMVGVDGGRG